MSLGTGPGGARPRWDMSGRVALVTGGSRGLGLAMARGFAEAGAAVAVASRKLEACEKAAFSITAETGAETLALAFHAGHWDEAEDLADRAYKHFGRIDVLVNNAGMSPLYPSLPEASEALFDKVIDVNLKGPFRLTVVIGPRMVAAGSGSIINVTSITAVKPRPEVLPYAAAKAGLNALTVGFAKAYGPDVRCNAIMAGTFLTDVSKSWDQEAFRQRAETFALRRAARPNEIVGTALYLASDAASYTTGAVIAVDGGQP
jgi:NAD(P)-dependent dehydrogenase (short-subunit alcohol dehydrogenase family)